LTHEVRELIPASVHQLDSQRFTLRVGNGLSASGVLIVGAQEEIARFDFEKQEDGSVTSFIQVLDAVEWAHFLLQYTRHLGGGEEQFNEIVEDLHQEAESLYPHIVEFTPE
jgi:ABC-type cobalamin/Fe3+-siderophores transport system ATPase subunit